MNKHQIERQIERLGEQAEMLKNDIYDIQDEIEELEAELREIGRGEEE